MSESMVERVLKAIMASGIASYHCGEEVNPKCIGLPDNCVCRNAAHAAIEAMREPTQEMIAAAGTEFIAYDRIYQRMIDAALKG